MSSPTGIDHINEVVRELGRALGKEDFQLDEEFQLTISIRRNTVVTLQYNPKSDELVVYSAVGSVAGIRDPVKLRSLLAANFMWRETSGTTLGLELETSIVTLAIAVPAKDLDFTSLDALLDGFATTAEGWTKRLAAMTEEEHDSGGPIAGIRI
ncbi:hypothetical protein DB346_08110 [Verrucomicrobia bacterium LW23]|nr:hypothetical protein DB346_08110 [Verrucomicrobia bacterium LW23]